MLSIFRGGGFAQVAKVGIAAAIVFAFAIEFRPGRNGVSGSLKLECAVELKGDCIDPKEYYAAFGLVMPRGVDPRAAKSLGLHKKTLDGLVERELLVAEARRVGISVSPDDVEKELVNGRAHVSLPAQDTESLSYQLGLCRRAEDGRGCEAGTDTGVRELRVKRTADEPFDYSVYEREIRMLTNRGPKEFKAMQERELLAARMRDLVRAPVRVSEAEAFSIFEQERSTAVIRSVQLDRKWFQKFTVDQSDAAIDRWAFENKAPVDAAWETDKAAFTAGCVPTSEIVLELGPGASDEDRAELRKKLDAAHARITAGESFASVARSVSEGATATAGGALGCVTASYGVGSEELAKAAAGLKAGEVSGIVETPRGMHLLRAEPKLEGARVEEFGRHFVARKAYLAAAGEAQVKAFGEQLIKRTEAGAKLEDAVEAQLATLVPAPAKKPGEEKAPPPPAALSAEDRPKVEISAPFSTSGNPVPQVTPHEPLAARAFELKNPDEVWKTPIATSEGALVIQLKEKNPASRADFDKNKAQLLGPLTEAKATDALARYLTDLRKQAGDKIKIDERFAVEPKVKDDE